MVRAAPRGNQNIIVLQLSLSALHGFFNQHNHNTSTEKSWRTLGFLKQLTKVTSKPSRSARGKRRDSTCQTTVDNALTHIHP